MLNCVLLVDDNEVDNYIHTRNIRKTGAAKYIKVVENGQEALNYLQHSSNENHPNLIFLDINMPVMDGIEFLKQYKCLKSTKEDIIIIMLTTSLITNDVNKIKELNLVSDFIVKPLSIDAFKNIIGKHFGFSCAA